MSCLLSKHLARKALTVLSEIENFHQKREKGRKSRPDFITLRDLYNDAAAKNGFAGATEEILHDYGSGTDIKSLVSTIWIDIFPLYKKLHSVVRYVLF